MYVRTQDLLFVLRFLNCSLDGSILLEAVDAKRGGLLGLSGGCGRGDVTDYTIPVRMGGG